MIFFTFVKMLCLHGKPAVTSTNEKGTFWSCAESPRCFKCSQEDASLYEKAINAFLATKQERPKCCPITGDTEGEWCYATFRVLTGKERRKFKEENIGRPFFTCGNNHRFLSSRGCGYFVWGDRRIIPVEKKRRVERKEDNVERKENDVERKEDYVFSRGTNMPNLFLGLNLTREKMRKKYG